MNLRIDGSKSLHGFTHAIAEGFRQEGCRIVEAESRPDFVLAQIHGSPAARNEDEKILFESVAHDVPVLYLIHRPDEMLLNPKFKAFFEGHRDARFILLGDLVFSLPFWRDRRGQCSVVPHPFLDFSVPIGRIPVIGAWASWGEMRDLNHYFSLVEALPKDRFEFWIGGSEIEPSRIHPHVKVVSQSFAPHFNVQLYHLRGKKRLGETSGSLHRGISVPVIFEANGAERIENLKVIQVDADEDLRKIDFAKAAAEIQALDLKAALAQNRLSAEKNTPRDFARAVLKFLNA